MKASIWRILAFCLQKIARLPLGLLPATLFLMLFLAVPLLLLFAYSFLTVERGEIVGGITLDVYGTILGDRFYWYLFVRTFFIACVVTTLCLIVGYPIAYVFIKASPLWRTVILVCVAAPLLTSALVRTFGWMVILGGRGIVNNFLVWLGLAAQPVRFLFTLEGVLIGMTQVLLPFMVVPLIATLQTLPSELEEAAANLGATKWRTFWAITVPQSVPGIAAGVSLVFILAYTEFTVSILMGGATFNVVSVYIFQTMTTLLDWARGAAMASVLLVSSLVIITIFNVAVRRLAPWAFLKA